MSAGKDFVRELLNIPRDVVNNHAESRFLDGFNEASAISVDAISAWIDNIHDKVRKGQELSGSEQAMLVGFSDLRGELETRLRDFWVDRVTG